MSNKELAAAVELAPSTCFERIRRLRERGVLGDHHATVDPEALGVGLQALISVRLRQHSRDEVEEFQAHALAQEEVLALFHVTGRQDFVLHVAVRDTEHLRDLAMDAFTSRAEVAQLETSLVFTMERKAVLPDYLG